jgi:class 3 adenylate cyclase
MAGRWPRSTRLRVALGESGAEALRRDHDEALGGAITRHRGQVVQGTGDGLLAPFHSVTDAVIAAEAVQAAAAALGVGRDHDVSVRVAVACGDVTWDGDRCFGGPVVEAMALCDLAEGGQVLCTTLVALLADSLEGLDLEKVGDHDIDGVERAVGVHELARAPS